MAFVPAATETTLQRVKSDVRSRTGTLGKKRVDIIEGQLESIIHDAFVSIRTLGGAALDSFYMMTEVLERLEKDENESTFDISTKNIARLGALTVYDTLINKEIDVMDTPKYRAHIASDSGLPEFNRARIAHITNKLINADNKLCLVAFYGDDLEAPDTLEFSYPRNPVRTTETEAGDDKIDFPESIVPIGKDMAVVMAFRKVGAKPPTEEETRVRAYLNSVAQSVGMDKVS